MTRRTCTRVSWLLAACLAVTAAGCYDPSLPDEPFTCAPTGKPCPDGYRCDLPRKRCVRDTGEVDAGVDLQGSDQSFVPTKDGPVRIDGALVDPTAQCIDRAAEPNNSADTAFLLQTTTSTLLTDWEICYPGDVDHYALNLSVGQRLTVTVIFKHADGDLDAALIDPDGFMILTSRSETDNEVLKLNRVEKAGKHIIAVWGFGSATNRYDLRIQIE